MGLFTRRTEEAEVSLWTKLIRCLIVENEMYDDPDHVKSQCHEHQCEDCGAVWLHPDSCSGAMMGDHNCPRCGAEELFKYTKGFLTPDFIYVGPGKYKEVKLGQESQEEIKAD